AFSPGATLVTVRVPNGVTSSTSTGSPRPAPPVPVYAARTATCAVPARQRDVAVTSTCGPGAADRARTSNDAMLTVPRSARKPMVGRRPARTSGSDVSSVPPVVVPPYQVHVPSSSAKTSTRAPFTWSGTRLPGPEPRRPKYGDDPAAPPT